MKAAKKVRVQPYFSQHLLYKRDSDCPVNATAKDEQQKDRGELGTIQSQEIKVMQDCSSIPSPMLLKKE